MATRKIVGKQRNGWGMQILNGGGNIHEFLDTANYGEATTTDTANQNGSRWMLAEKKKLCIKLYTCLHCTANKHIVKYKILKLIRLHKQKFSAITLAHHNILSTYRFVKGKKHIYIYHSYKSILGLMLNNLQV